MIVKKIKHQIFVPQNPIERVNRHIDNKLAIMGSFLPNTSKRAPVAMLANPAASSKNNTFDI
jgi:hypothetical protein